MGAAVVLIAIRRVLLPSTVSPTALSASATAMT